MTRSRSCTAPASLTRSLRWPLRRALASHSSCNGLSVTLCSLPPRESQPSARTRPETELRPQTRRQRSAGTQVYQGGPGVQSPRRRDRSRGGRTGRKGRVAGRRTNTHCEKSPRLAPLAGVGIPRFAIGGVELDPAQIHSRRESDGGWVGRFHVREESTHTPPRRGSERKREESLRAQKHCKVGGQIGWNMDRIDGARLALR